MPDFLTRRCGTWHFVRRVPVEFARLDERRIVKHSTKVRIAQDPNVDGVASAWGENRAFPATTETLDAGDSGGIVDAPILMTTQIAQYSNGNPIGFDAGSPGSTIGWL